MGQYYRPFVADNSGTVSILKNHDFECFSKLTEHSWISNPFVNAVYTLISKSTKRVAWIGDYANDHHVYVELRAASKGKPFPEWDQYSEYCLMAWGDDVSTLPRSQFPDDEFLSDYVLKKKKKFLLNHSQQSYLDMTEYAKKNTRDGWCVNPLPILTACGNGQGGGDYHSQVGIEDVGSWAFDFIEFSSKVPTDYKKEVYFFIIN